MLATLTPFSASALRSCARAGDSSPRRFRAANLLLSIVLLSSGCLVLGACDTGLSGNVQPRAKPEALAGLLPRPDLPELRVTCGEQSVAGVRAGYAWTVDGNAKQLDEVWPPPTPSGRLLVSPGEVVTFAVTLPPGSPAAVTAGKDAVTSRINVWDAFVARDSQETALLYSGDCEPGEGKAPVARFSWRMPEDLAHQPSGNSFVVRIIVTWGDSAGAATGVASGAISVASSDAVSSPCVSFYWNLVAVEKDVPDAVLEAARRYFDATWAGDEETLSKVSPRWSVNEPAAIPGASPLRAYLPGPRDPIFWKSPSQTFKMVSRPSFVVNSVHPSASGPYAECLVEYQVDLRDVQSGKSGRQVVREQVHLMKDDYGSWTVSWAHRTPLPVEAQNGGPGSAGAGLCGLPGLAVRDEEFGAVVQVGPFENAQPYSGQKWSDDGEWFAFTGSACGVNGIWAASRDGSRLVNLVGLEGTDVELVDWAPGQHKVRFLTYGYHSCGPHADKTGYWVGEVDPETREVRDIAFVRYPRVSFPRDVAMPEGRRYLVFRHTPDLWRVDMETGEVTKMAGDVPSWDGLLRLRYSPSAWLAAYGQPFGSNRPGFTVYDLKAGEQRFVGLSDVSSGPVWAHFEGWTPKEELMVLVCKADEVNHGEDSSEPAGATAIRLYSPAGSLLEEILSLEGDADSRIGPVAWNADGSAVAIAVGCISEPFMDRLGWLEMQHQATAICVWTRSDGALRRVADISGQVASLSWVEDDKAIEAWFRVPDDPEVKTQVGVRVESDGSPAEVQRPITDRVEEGDVVVGSLGDLILVERIGSAGGSTLVVRSDAGDGKETVVNDIGPLYLYERVMSSGAFAVSGEVPDKYGEGAHWVYLVVQQK